jgi:O-antigen ligase
MAIKSRGPNIYLKIITAFILVVFVIISVPSFRNIALSTASKYTNVANTNEGNARGRLIAWEESVNIWFETNPLFGIGLGTPASVFVDRYGVRTHPHNSYLTVGLRSGLFGFCLLFSIMYQAYMYALRSIRNGIKQKLTLIPYALAFLLCQAATAITAFFNVVLEGPYMGSFFWLFIGATISAIRIAFQSDLVNEPKKRKPNRWHRSLSKDKRLLAQ